VRSVVCHIHSTAPIYYRGYPTRSEVTAMSDRPVRARRATNTAAKKASPPSPTPAERTAAKSTARQSTPTSTRVKRATAADLPGIQQLMVDAYTKYIERIGRPPAPMTADYAAALEHSRVWVLEDHAAIIGALVTEDRTDHLLLETVAVSPGVQGSGYGRLLLERAERDAVELGLTEVRLYTNEAMTENLSFYPRHGYRETGRATNDGFRRVYFSKTVRHNDVGNLRSGDRGDHLEGGGLPK
jgi:N-acetylglutamate synthase-like GNAT family acetyltransferase